jgi:hypothetical protein
LSDENQNLREQLNKAADNNSSRQNTKNSSTSSNSAKDSSSWGGSFGINLPGKVGLGFSLNHGTKT